MGILLCIRLWNKAELGRRRSIGNSPGGGLQWFVWKLGEGKIYIGCMCGKCAANRKATRSIITSLLNPYPLPIIITTCSDLNLEDGSAYISSLWFHLCILCIIFAGNRYALTLRTPFGQRISSVCHISNVKYIIGTNSDTMSNSFACADCGWFSDPAQLHATLDQPKLSTASRENGRCVWMLDHYISICTSEKYPRISVCK